MTTSFAVPQRHTTRRAPAAATRKARVAVRPQDLVDLLARRPDLVGVYKPADVAVEAIRWSV
ncbi:hypothetical protein [Nocardioides sp. T2.26MG-1]|uniref:hypothetical protein n=1 Tax=Nocardioides sp. T2.26MG-1 TaxID=3041166 RepID=UPI0024779E81|nr:hypothetical protein [Nocardioides sp. T2.26MG-1]CAI9402276.1 hypothetical protein HIDPHFAB_00782 [Nocardioides sp. T2.26MG-1]